jgi:hypothetical protein
MSNLDEALRMLKLGIGRLEEATVDLADVKVVQAAKASIENVIAVLTGNSTLNTANPSLTLRTVARAIQPIDEPSVREAWADTIEAAILLENSADLCEGAS